MTHFKNSLPNGVFELINLHGHQLTVKVTIKEVHQTVVRGDYGLAQPLNIGGVLRNWNRANLTFNKNQTSLIWQFLYLLN